MSVTLAVGPFLHDVLAWKLIAWMLRFAAVASFLLASIDGSVWIVLIVAAQNVAGVLPLAPGTPEPAGSSCPLAFAGRKASAVVGFGVGMQAATGCRIVLAP